MISRAVSVAYWLFVLATALLLFPVALLLWALTAPWDKRRAVLHQFTCLWASLYSWCNPLWRVQVQGREHIVPGTTYMMVANHTSATDIFVLFRLFKHFKWVAKREIFRVPMIGWNMRLNGYIALRRGDKESIAAMLEACRRALAQGSSIMMFPEGTRSATGELRPFKRGAFELAKSQNVPIVPIALVGAPHALPKGGFLCGPAKILVRVLPPLPPASFADTEVPALAEQVRQCIAAALAAVPDGRFK